MVTLGQRMAPLRVTLLGVLVAHGGYKAGTMERCHPESKKRESLLRYGSLG